MIELYPGISRNEMSIKDQVLLDLEATAQPGSLNPPCSLLRRPLSSALFKEDVALREEKAYWDAVLKMALDHRQCD